MAVVDGRDIGVALRLDLRCGRSRHACADAASASRQEPVDRAVLGGSHQPGAGALPAMPSSGQSLERGDKGILRQFLGEADIRTIRARPAINRDR